MKNAALFNGALVVPSSSTLGIELGRGVGSLYGWLEVEPSWYALIVGRGSRSVHGGNGGGE